MLYPNFEELLQLGYRAGKLHLTSKRPVLSIVSGDHRSPFRGKGLEFEEVREYVHGDDVRNIDWRVTARTGKPHLKLFAEERERSILICTDVNHTMRFGTRGTFKSIQTARAAALLGWTANHENNRVGGSFFGNVPDGMIFIDPTRSRHSLWRMLKQLCNKQDYFDDYVPLEGHLRYLSKAVPSGALVFIISDFMLLTGNLKKRISDLNRRADVVLVSVNDPADEFLPPIGAVVFSDHKEQKITVDTADKKGATAYQDLWQKNRDTLQSFVNSLGLGYIALSTNHDIMLDLTSGVKKLGKKGGKSYAARPTIATA
jgi:uncharacterized protein (DUF58 family)